MAKPWKEAATVILLARNLQQNVTKSSSSKFNYKLLMLERSSKSKFMPSAYVFPGGRTDNDDFSTKWNDILNQCSSFTPLPTIVQMSERPEIFSPQSESNLATEFALRVCAIRETFEETGILMYKDFDCHAGSGKRLSKGIFKQFRKALHNDELSFYELCKELEVVPNVWSLYEWSDWLTPTNMKKMHSGKRYDTVFFISTLDKYIDSIQDDNEIVSSEWISPDDLFQCYTEEKLWIAPPQVYEVGRLHKKPEFDALKEFIKTRSMKGCEQWLPVRMNCTDGTIAVLPGDDLYPEEVDYEGKQDIPHLDGTMEEMKNKAVKLHRMHFVGPHKCPIYCNIPQKFGHLDPVAEADQ